MTILYVIAAPGVGYMQHENRSKPHDRWPNEHSFTSNLKTASKFRSVAGAIAALQTGEAGGMVGVSINKIMEETQPSFIDLGEIA